MSDVVVVEISWSRTAASDGLASELLAGLNGLVQSGYLLTAERLEMSMLGARATKQVVAIAVAFAGGMAINLTADVVYDVLKAYVAEPRTPGKGDVEPMLILVDEKPVPRDPAAIAAAFRAAVQGDS